MLTIWQNSTTFHRLRAKACKVDSTDVYVVQNCVVLTVASEHLKKDIQYKEFSFDFVGKVLKFSSRLWSNPVFKVRSFYSQYYFFIVTWLMSLQGLIR